MIVLFVLTIGLAICGWLCVFRTEALVEQQQKNYAKHGFVRAYPFSSMVLKSWYPTYLRCAGVFAWVWDAVIIYLVWIRKPR
jgi:hypothetical protein